MADWLWGLMFGGKGGKYEKSALALFTSAHLQQTGCE